MESQESSSKEKSHIAHQASNSDISVVGSLVLYQSSNIFKKLSSKNDKVYSTSPAPDVGQNLLKRPSGQSYDSSTSIVVTSNESLLPQQGKPPLPPVENSNENRRTSLSATVSNWFVRQRSSTEGPPSTPISEPSQRNISNVTDIPPIRKISNISSFNSSSSQSANSTMNRPRLSSESAPKPTSQSSLTSRRRSKTYQPQDLSQKMSFIKKDPTSQQFTIIRTRELTSDEVLDVSLDAKKEKSRIQVETGSLNAVKRSRSHNTSDHKRIPTMRTFITSDRGEIEVLDSKRTPLNLDSFKIPRRWLSLRNLISFLNIVILTIAIFIISLVSYYGGLQSERRLISSLAHISANNVNSKLDDLLSNINNINIYTQNIFLTAYSISQSYKTIPLLYRYLADTNANIEKIYGVLPDNTYLGIGNIASDKYVITYLNKTTSPYLVSYNVSNVCNYNQPKCYQNAFPSSNDSFSVIGNVYNVSNRPFYITATRNMRSSWTSIYIFASTKVPGITAAHPVYTSKNKINFVSAVDLSVDDISQYLSKIAQAQATGNLYIPSIFVVEASTGYLIGSSTGLSTLELSSAYSNSELSESMNLIRNQFGNIFSINWQKNGDYLEYSTSTANIIIYRYNRYAGDINWILIIYIPNLTFNQFNFKELYITLPLAAIVVLLIATVCSVLVTRAIGKPLKRIAQQILHIAELNLDDDTEEDNELNEKKLSGGLLPRFYQDCQTNICTKAISSVALNLKELQYLNTAMNAMKSGLKSFSKYVPLEVVTLLMKLKREAIIGVDDIPLTVFFSDIVNFTQISESITPEQLVQFMEEYLSEMSDIILQHHGVVDKYIGDAIMAFWNAPISIKDHATIACSVAIKSQQKLANLRTKWVMNGLPNIRARIGINTGNALVGNVGSSSRLNYTCLGDTVNLASRLEGLNKKYNTDIIISEHTKELIHPDMFVTRPLDIVVVKGKSTAVKVYELVGFKKQMNQHKIATYYTYERSFELFCERQFAAAKEGFTVFLSIYPNDTPSQIHLAKCIKYIDSPPDANWNCALVLDEK